MDEWTARRPLYSYVSVRATTLSTARYLQGVGLLNQDYQYCGEDSKDESSAALVRKSNAANKMAEKQAAKDKGHLCTQFDILSLPDH